MDVERDKKLAFPRLVGLLAKSPTRLSQAMHNAAFRARGLDYLYVAFDTEDTFGAIAAMRTLGIRGYSLTIPHKEVALNLVDDASNEARKIGCINTILNDGKNLFGHNTDWDGIVRAFEEAEISVRGKGVLIYGAGGAARAVIFAMQRMGAAELTLVNRTPRRAEKLAEEFQCKFLSQEGLLAHVFDSHEIVINASPIGSKLVQGNAVQFPFQTRWIGSQHTVFDLVTSETALLRDAKQYGAKTISGVRMLLFQACHQFQLFTGEQDPPQKEMELALYAELGEDHPKSSV